MDTNFGKFWEMVRDREAWCAAVHEVAKSQTWLGDWTTTLCGIGKSYFSNLASEPLPLEVLCLNHWTTRKVPLPQQRKALLSHIPFQGPRDPLLVAEGKGQTSPHVCVCMLSCFCCVQLFAMLWTVACKAPLPMRFSRQEYWSGLLCPPSGDLPDWGIEPVSLTSNQNWQAGFFFF